MPTIERFEDLQCWQAGRQLRRTVMGYLRRSEVSGSKFKRDAAANSKLQTPNSKS
jgi:hypothetical protein